MTATPAELQKAYLENTLQLAELNRELAEQMLLLSAQTGDASPLKQAVNALEKANKLYSAETTPRETIEVRQMLADTLYKIGRKTDDVDAIEKSIKAYRSAITLASMLGDQPLRTHLKQNYGRARSLALKLGKSAASRAA